MSFDPHYPINALKSRLVRISTLFPIFDAKNIVSPFALDLFRVTLFFQF